MACQRRLASEHGISAVAEAMADRSEDTFLSVPKEKWRGGRDSNPRPTV